MDNTVISEPVTQEPATQEPATQAPSRPRSQRPTTITYALITVNVLVFLAMVARGVSFFAPTPLDIFNWGGDYGPATVGANQWWRLLTSMFLHFGIIHIGFNMYVLYQIGPFIETVFGRIRYLVIYFFAGLSGSVVSVWIHPNAVGAGASGAIFGLYGAVFGFSRHTTADARPSGYKGHCQVRRNLHPLQRHLRVDEWDNRPLRSFWRFGGRISNGNAAGALAADCNLVTGGYPMRCDVFAIMLLMLSGPPLAMAQTPVSATAETSTRAETNMRSEPPLYRIEMHRIKKGQGTTYEAAVKSLIHGLTSANIELPSWDFSVATDGDSTYFTIDPMPGWAMLDHFNDEGMAVQQTIPEVWSAFRRDVRSVRERETDFFIQAQPNADDPGALGENGRDFMRMAIYYPKDSHAVLTSLNSARKLCPPQTTGMSCRVYISVTGDDLPFFIFVRSAKDRERFLTAESLISKSSQAAIGSQLQQATQNSKRVQQMDLTIRQDLSYHVPQAATTAH